ncbi:hypothetical protein NPIL_251291 [Nephila pilipes]|uniref:Uncharacterized protein n=1 Tax=Nephila pilipes TaxID=299642 RepID=A0A8X6QMR5_NEPPI|nr:hypothetical protein NPIL_251291 [Nephila pilipes]
MHPLIFFSIPQMKMNEGNKRRYYRIFENDFSLPLMGKRERHVRGRVRPPERRTTAEHTALISYRHLKLFSQKEENESLSLPSAF